MMILITDDEPDIRSLVRSTLSEYAIVLEASGGEEAISQAWEWKPDLILMDIAMPKLNGYTACSTIKGAPATRDISVVMLAGPDHKVDEKLAKAMGANGHMPKPFTQKDLLKTIRKHVLKS